MKQNVESKGTEVYVTKYALTQGIFKIPVEITENGYAQQLPKNKIGFFLSKNEYGLTIEEALKNAETLREKKIQSLKKQIAKIEKIDFKSGIDEE